MTKENGRDRGKEGDKTRRESQAMRKNLFPLMWVPESAWSFLSIQYLRFHQNCSAIVLGSPIESKLSLPLKIGTQSRLISITRPALVSAAGSHQPAGSAARMGWKRGVSLMSFNLLVQSTNRHLFQQPSTLPYHFFLSIPRQLSNGFHKSTSTSSNVIKQHNQ